MSSLVRLLNPMRAMRFARSLWRDARREGPRGGPGMLGIARDQISLFLATGLGPKEYYRYRLYEPGLTWEDKTSFISRRGLEQVWKTMNPPAYRFLYANKLVFRRHFAALGLPLAELLGVYDPTWGATADGRPLRDSADLERWIRSGELDGPGAVFKPIESAQGKMILVFTGRKPGDPKRLVTLDGREFDPDRLDAFLNDPALLRDAYPDGDVNRSFLVEQRAVQHPELVGLVGETLSCVRVHTLVSQSGRPEVVAAVIKLQPEPTGLDHAGRGSIIAAVDLESGTLGEGRKIGEPETIRHRVVPGRGGEIVGYRLPCWPEVKDVSLRAAAAFPWCRAIGWDVGITDRGPVLIEGNEGWSSALVQIAHRAGLMRGEFRSVYQATLGHRRRGS